MQIDTEKICKDYGNVTEFLKSFGFSHSIYKSLRYKKTCVFKNVEGGSFKLFKKLEKMGYIKDENVA